MNPYEPTSKMEDTRCFFSNAHMYPVSSFPLKKKGEQWPVDPGD